jgi:hypothetical protein
VQKTRCFSIKKPGEKTGNSVSIYDNINLFLRETQNVENENPITWFEDESYFSCFPIYFVLNWGRPSLKD